MTKLYELADHYRVLHERLEDGEDVSDALAQLDGALEQKSLAIMHVMRDLDLEVEAFKTEEQRLAARRKTLEAQRTKLKDYVLRCMQDADVVKLKAGTFQLAVREDPEHVVIEDEALIPDTYVRTKREPNKAAILDAYRTTGECVPGTRIARGYSLRTR